MYKRYDLLVSYNSVVVYSCSFSSLNLMVKIACGFDRNVCDIDATDTLLEKTIPVTDYCQIFQDDINGI